MPETLMTRDRQALMVEIALYLLVGYYVLWPILKTLWCVLKTIGCTEGL